MKKIVYQKHHPDRENAPDWTIRLRRWQHLVVRRCEQYKATEGNLDEMNNLIEALMFVRDKIEENLPD